MTTILQNLTASPSSGEWTEPRGNVSAVHHEVAPGCLVYVTLGVAGVSVFHGESKVGIPLDAIIALAQAHDASLKPQPKPDNVLCPSFGADPQP